MSRLQSIPQTASLLGDMEPLLALEGWPGSSHLACLYSGQADDPKSRWSLLAETTQTLVCHDDPREFLQQHIGLPTRPPLARSNATDAAPPDSPFGPGWVIAISYDAGAFIEPKARLDQSGATLGASTTCAIARVNGGFVHDRQHRSWHRFGELTSTQPIAQTPLSQSSSPNSFAVKHLRSATGRDRFLAQATRVKAYIREGDAYQVNLSHDLRGSFEGSPRALFRALAMAARPWHGLYLELPTQSAHPRAICSASPELFLRYDPRTRRVTTRPMKGTAASIAPEESLRASPKDQAELNMIIDLMRNDLGRSCIIGSVQVDEPRTIERHTSVAGEGLLQATGTVSGTLRTDRSPLDLLWNAFPPGSITGAPKLRAMQIIQELEQRPRGFYCGTLGFIGDDGQMMLNVGIRTATVENGHITYPVGAGIVADSDEAAEWDETLAKAWPIISISQGFDAQ